jgi:hypothetical protein
MDKTKKISKYTLQQVQEIALLNNCELLSNSYTKNTVILQFKCICQTLFDMSFKKYLVQKCCEDCHKKTLIRIFKYTYKDVESFFEKEKCVLLSTTYDNQVAKLDYMCNCGNQSTISFKMFLIGNRCMKCAIERRKETNVIIYGNACSLNSEKEKTIRANNKEALTDKRKQSSLIKYGYEYPMQNNDVKEKRKQSNLIKYGCEIATQNDDIKQKIKETNLIKYGYENPVQNAEIFKKSQKNGMHYKTYILPSGKEIHIQGYENFAMDILLKTYQEDEIHSDRKDMPEIWYKYKNVKRRYFPDIYIPKENLIIEVKSLWTYNRYLIKNIHKALAVRKDGYNYEFWIMDKKKLEYII